MKASTLLKISAAAGAAALGAAAYKMLGTASSVTLGSAGCAGVFEKDGKPVAAYASTGLRPVSIAGLTGRVCGWLCIKSGHNALKKKVEAFTKK